MREVRGDRDDRFRDLGAEDPLCVLAHRLEDDGADVDRREVVVAEPHEHAAIRRLLHPVGHPPARIRRLAAVEPAAHEALDAVDRRLRVREDEVLRGLSDHEVPVLERYDGRDPRVAVGILEDLGPTLDERGSDRVRGAEIDSDGLTPDHSGSSYQIA